MKDKIKKQVKRIKLLVKSVGYALQLMYRSSGLMIGGYFLLKIIGQTVPLVSIYLLNIVLDQLGSGTVTLSAFVPIILGYVGVLVVSQACGAAQNTARDHVVSKARHAYDMGLYQKLAKLPMSVVDTSEGKDLVDEVRYMGYQCTNMVEEVIDGLAQVYTFVVTFSVLVTFNLGFSLLFFVMAMPGAIIDVVFDLKNELMRRDHAPDVRRFNYYRWILTDGWPAKDVRMYNLTDPIKARYDTEKHVYREANKKLDQKKLSVSTVAEVIKRSGEFIFTLFVLMQAIDGKISIGSVALYTGYVLTATNALHKMTDTFGGLYVWTVEGMAYLFKFQEIACPQEQCGSRPLEGFESLVFEDVYFKYPLSESYVLKGASFSLKKGDKLSIIGINGAGKSTLIKLMLGLYPIEKGRILINGYEMSEYEIGDVRRLFSILFQTFVQYPLSLRDNVVLSDLARQGDDAAVLEALSKSGMDEHLGKFHQGLDTYMTRQFDDEGVELSKGQWQKIALSRAYFKDAPIIVFDEPSAALDAQAENQIFENFEAIAQEKTGIMISHRISSAKLSNKVIVLDQGRIIEQGTHEELVATEGLYAKLYELQREKYAIKEAQ